MQDSSKPFSRLLAILPARRNRGPRRRRQPAGPAGSRGPRVARDHRAGRRAHGLDRGGGLRDTVPARDDPAGPAVRRGRRGHQRRDATLPSRTLPGRPVQPADGQGRQTHRRARAGASRSNAGRNSRPRSTTRGSERSASPKRRRTRSSSTRSWSAGSRARLDGVRDLRGRPSYVISFEPRPGKLPVRRRIDHALNKSRGEVWIDTKTYEIARIGFQLIDRVRLWWGIIGSISHATGRLERRPVADDVWLDTEFEVYFPRAGAVPDHPPEHADAVE